MPTNVSLKNVPDDIMEKLRKRAKRHHRSLQGELLAIMEEAVGPDKLYAPVLLAYELTNIARRKIITYPEKADILKEALKTAFALPIHWSEVDHLAVLSLALVAKLTTYDAWYLYLARKLGVPLATFDQKPARTDQTS